MLVLVSVFAQYSMYSSAHLQAHSKTHGHCIQVQCTLCTVYCRSSVQSNFNCVQSSVQPNAHQCTCISYTAQSTVVHIQCTLCSFSVHASVQSICKCTVQCALQCTSAVQFKCNLDNLVCSSSAHLGHMWAHLVYSQKYTPSVQSKEHSPVYIPVLVPYPGQCTVYRTLYSPVYTSVHLVCKSSVQCTVHYSVHSSV